MTEPRILAIVRGADDLQAALRGRAIELRLVFDGRTRLGDINGKPKTLDKIAGLPDGYSAKLLAPVPLKSFGRYSLGPMLTVLGTKLLLVEDLEALMQITSRVEKEPHANGAMLTVGKGKKRRYRKLGPQWGKIMRARATLLVSGRKRKLIASNAALARWSKPRVVEVKGAKAKAIRGARTSPAAGPRSP